MRITGRPQIGAQYDWDRIQAIINKKFSRLVPYTITRLKQIYKLQSANKMVRAEMLNLMKKGKVNAK